MAVTKLLPLDISDHWLGTTNIPVSIMLLRDDVTSVPETFTDVSGISGLEVASGGGYTAGAYGIAMPVVNRVTDVDSGVVEYDTGGAVYSSTSSYSVDNFRWLVANSAGIPLVVWDLATSHDLVAEPLVLAVAASPNITGCYPILRFKRFLA